MSSDGLFSVKINITIVDESVDQFPFLFVEMRSSSKIVNNSDLE